MTFTSGSTGKPKGIVRSCDFLLLQHQLLECGRRTAPDDIDLISLPMFILSNLTAGATSVLPAGDLRKPARMNGARLRRQIVRHQINRVIAPPALCARIAEAPCPSLTAIFTGGGPVFPDLWRTLSVSAPNARICAVYGSTEAEPIAHIDWRDIADADWTAMAAGGGLLAGRPIPEIALAFRDHEIEVAGPHVNATYHDRASNAGVKIARNGRIWHRTGDCGRLDGSGRLWLLGRKSGASANAVPFAIEAAALSWPGVRQAALIAEGEHARLAVAGERLDMPDLSRRAERIGVRQLTELRAVPMDRRHNSKVDYARLRALLA
jgi:acyl-coenzyme A synthetase/AMP-(fatty) acid ligase